MANYFVRSTDGSDADNGTTWALAKATLAGAFAVAAAGDTIFVSDNHAETQATAMTLASPGTAAAPVRVLCVDDAGDPANPATLAATATISTTGASNINFGGFAYCYGITISVGSGGTGSSLLWTSASAYGWLLESCVLKIGNTGNGSRIAFGDTGSARARGLIRLINTDLQFSQADQALTARNIHLVEWLGGTLQGTIPTGGLFKLDGGYSGKVVIKGIDLSGLGSNPIYSLGLDWCGFFTAERCKLGTSFALTTGSFSGPHSAELAFDNCDSGDTNYKMARRSYAGDVDQETTIVRSGGASDGTTAISWKMTSSANVTFHTPLASPDIYIWNETIGSAITITAEVVTDNVTLTDGEAWLELDYLGNSGFPYAAFADDAQADTLASPANQTTSSVTWTTTGLTTPVKQKLAVTVTPQEKGLIRAKVNLAKASATMYVDPKLDIS